MPTNSGTPVSRGLLISRRKSGDLYEEDATITPIHDEGSLMEFVCVSRDHVDSPVLTSDVV